ncbi:MAG: hypothetical protein DRI40_02205 [Chloroflexi bacterium]|nr:MAG: hypothetical protein DRI40_02205 [Chloroflexota bacterium]
MLRAKCLAWFKSNIYMVNQWLSKVTQWLRRIHQTDNPGHSATALAVGRESDGPGVEALVPVTLRAGRS